MYNIPPGECAVRMSKADKYYPSTKDMENIPSGECAGWQGLLRFVFLSAYLPTKYLSIRYFLLRVKCHSGIFVHFVGVDIVRIKCQYEPDTCIL